MYSIVLILVMLIKSLDFRCTREFLELLNILFYVFLLLEALEVLGEDNYTFLQRLEQNLPGNQSKSRNSEYSMKCELKNLPVNMMPAQLPFVSTWSLK